MLPDLARSVKEVQSVSLDVVLIEVKIGLISKTKVMIKMSKTTTVTMLKDTEVEGTIDQLGMLWMLEMVNFIDVE